MSIVDSLTWMASSVDVFGWSSNRFIDWIDTGDLRGTVFEYIEGHQWERVRTLLQHLETASVNPYELGLANVDDDGRNLLHAVCSNAPPLDIVMSVARIFPEMIDATDECFRRTPVHEAVMLGASVKAVKFLLKSKPECATIKDADGKTPLILVCQQIGWVDGDDTALSYLCKLAQDLAMLFPSSVLAEDAEGMTALEHALDGEAPSQTIRVLQHTTSNMNKEMNAAEHAQRRAEMARLSSSMC